MAFLEKSAGKQGFFKTQFQTRFCSLFSLFLCDPPATLSRDVFVCYQQVMQNPLTDVILLGLLPHLLTAFKLKNTISPWLFAPCFWTVESAKYKASPCFFHSRIFLGMPSLQRTENRVISPDCLQSNTSADNINAFVSYVALGVFLKARTFGEALFSFPEDLRRIS